MKYIRCLLTFLIGLGIADTVCAQRFDALQQEVQTYVDGQPGEVGVAVIRNGKESFSVNNERMYPMMSVFKFHQAVAVADLLEAEGLPVSTTVYVRKEDLHENTWSPMLDKYRGKEGLIPISELLTYTLQWSDNNACDILFDQIVPVDETDGHLRMLGLSDFSISSNEREMHGNEAACYENWSSPMATAELMDKLFVRGVPTAGPRAFVVQTMMDCETGQNRLPAAWKGTAVKYGHKTGTGIRNANGAYIAVNDCGFAFLPNGDRYVIAVFIKDWRGEVEAAEAVIAHISKLVYAGMLRAAD